MPILNPKLLQFSPRQNAIAFGIASLFVFQSSYAQVDAGALQQGLEQQLPLPSPLALPEPERAAPDLKIQVLLLRPC